MKKYIVTVDGEKFEVLVQEAAIGSSNETAPKAEAKAVEAPKPAPVAAAPKAEPKKEAAPVSADGAKITAPLPGTILKVIAKQGQSVKQGDILCILEAMKMENEIVAPQNGTIASVSVNEGATVGSGDLLFVIA
ncbi:MAG: acetyl-CoA carboxylase biotin carboxyl carrier protein subunit [Firmicutes bacterium HGW-Firmicutes-21]|nr:MAG: acetyl-CoA carboxylase biotin carboxyl carrier protein subunit [Firmicutes bacterium HGW-Firmicutes-21]